MADGELQFPAFPFQPYPIQQQFMSAVYRALQKGGVAIVESPTGTGKTLSLICSTLQWLEDEHAHRLSSSRKGEAECAKEDEEPDWMRDFEVNKEEQKLKEKEEKKQRRKLQLVSDSAKKVSSSRSFFGDVDERFGGKQRIGKSKKPVKTVAGALEDDEFLVEDYCSDDNASSGEAVKRKPEKDISSSSEEDVEDEDEEEEPLKVFFCSRTHSQLSQFVGELQRTKFATSLQSVSLGSRKTLCINPEVAKLGSSARINERCLELHKAKSSGHAGLKAVKDNQMQRRKVKSSGCPLLKKQRLQRQFKEKLELSSAMDVEDLVKLGQELGTCPYYGSRRAVPTADLVVLPYQSLLNSSTRESLGVKLKDCVVIIDEAHNLVDTVNSIHSCQVSATQLRQVSSQLSEYLEKFKNRLADSNRQYIETLLLLIKAFLDCLAVPEPGGLKGGQIGGAKSKMLTINDFLFSLKIDGINLFKLRRYIKESNIVHKVSSYGEKVISEQTVSTSQSRSGFAKGTIPQVSNALTGFHALADLVLALTNADKDGRVLVVPSVGKGLDIWDGHLKFVMLNATKHFTEIVEEAKTVILAGGTLQPISELRDRLFPQLPHEKVHLFSCGHIVPPESILPLAIARGPGGHTFDFTYQSRSSQTTIEELGRLISNVSSVVPEGIVVFFPSFEYESQVHATWADKGMLASIQLKKHVYREPRSASEVEDILQRYKDSIIKASNQTDKATHSQRGALLLCVVGGKMSEGINFSDGMGRCVVMVGLPYPSPSDPELIERMRYIDQLPAAEVGVGNSVTASNGNLVLQRCGQRGREYYDNLCMKAVNQSIGRAIRHIGDYAAILLVDVRYTSTSSPSGPNAKPSGPASKLPEWIKERLVQVTGSFGEVHKLLHQFFKHNQQRIQGN
ncbi:hypothetical protein M758_7G058100 [Ceratodon purpureus]|uniref:Helicase ATP-binding domain-containing protein n=1 Tax=Ceratodon purpureus TaxID=3225 RepID=A0A8T0H817_CERPU|nr:hypothetical protein KC19_7G061000 [Ceratodon purpureus]KAG0610344.1 hypothetical protein M758_7G058100 [Ceratodon purpureus]